MKKLFLLGLAVVIAVALNANVFAQTDTATSQVSGNLGTSFAVEFYPRTDIDEADANIAFPNGGPITFTDADPALPIVYPDGREEDDGKSDVGLLCLSNIGTQYYLKVHMTSTDLDDDNFVVYLNDVAYNRNVDPAEELTGMQQPKRWYKMWMNTPHTIYAADSAHWNTVAWGTLVPLSYALIPSGKFVDENNTTICDGEALDSGSFSATITYTMTTTP